jgi:hypothetical protein
MIRLALWLGICLLVGPVIAGALFVTLWAVAYVQTRAGR